MIVVNFSHPLSDSQRQQLESVCGQAIARTIDVPVQCAHAEPFAEQASSIVSSAGLSASEWQTLPILVVPPSLASIAVACIAELHGRIGHFPAVVRLRPRQGSMPTVFDVAEVINLQSVRDGARAMR